MKKHKNQHRKSVKKWKSTDLQKESNAFQNQKYQIKGDNHIDIVHFAFVRRLNFNIHTALKTRL